MTNELVSCSALCRTFGSLKALDDLDLTLKRGRIVGLAAPNGAGKTTLIKILAGILQPTSGSALIDGRSPGVYTKSITSYMPDRPSFAEWMKVQDALDLFSDFYADFDLTKAGEICRIAFEKLDIIRITGVYYEPNAASGRVLEKVGFEYEGTRKNGVAKGDKIYDLCMTGLLKERFQENQ